MDKAERLIGSRIAQARKNKNLSQEQLAELCNIAPCTISRIETGRNSAPVKTLLNIAANLNIGLDYLFYDLLPKESTNRLSPQIEEIVALLEKLDENEQKFVHTMLSQYVFHLLN